MFSKEPLLINKPQMSVAGHSLAIRKVFTVQHQAERWQLEELTGGPSYSISRLNRRRDALIDAILCGCHWRKSIGSSETVRACVL